MNVLLVIAAIAFITARAVGRSSGWDRPPCSDDVPKVSKRLHRTIRREVAAASARAYIENYQWN